MNKRYVALLLWVVLVISGPLTGGIALASSTSRIAASPEYLVLYAVEGATATQTQTFYIANGGTGTLNFNLSKSTGWFGVNSTSGSASTNRATITVTVNPSGLGSGGSPYIGDITISNADVSQDTKKVRVRDRKSVV